MWLTTINRCPALILNRSYKCVYNQARLFACSKWSNKSTIRWKIRSYWLMSLLELLWLQTNLDDFVTSVLPNESRADWQRLAECPVNHGKGRVFAADSDGWAALPRSPLGLLHLCLSPPRPSRSTEDDRYRETLIKIQYFPHAAGEERAGGAPSVLLEDVSVL